MSSLAVVRGLERELCWLGDLFTAAELAAAELLLKLGGDDEEEAAAASADTVVDEESKEERAVEDAVMKFSSRRSASSSCQVPVEEEEPWPVVKETAPSLGSMDMELDRRARKRYRLLSELYAAPSPIWHHPPPPRRRGIRKLHGDDGAGTFNFESSVDQATRNGGELVAVRAQKGFCVITP
ncbi:hypothetical protein ZWY2020_036692 [Hordeum vulgare]|nr:hypothetical protein ZWY2020_036692 [Hordeum vulgare]